VVTGGVDRRGYGWRWLPAVTGGVTGVVTGGVTGVVTGGVTGVVTGGVDWRGHRWRYRRGQQVA